MGLPLADAVAAYNTGVDALLAADVDTPSHHDLVAAFAAIETGSRRVPMAGYAIVARLDREADARALGATSLWQLLKLRTRMSKGQAVTRIARARALIGSRTMQGEVLAPEWEHTAAALSRGTIGDEHVEVIRKFFTALPSRVDPLTRAQAEQTLAEVATRLDPSGLTTAAIHLLALLHPDGEAPVEEVARKVGLTLGNQQPDGTSYLSGWISPKLRALIEPVAAKFAERNRHSTPDDETVEDRTLVDQESAPATASTDEVAAEDNPFSAHPDDPPLPRPEPVLDHQWRTKSQHLHDAVGAAFDLLLRSGTLGRLNGLPTTVVVTTTLQELLRGAGYAVTGGGSRLPMRDLIAQAANAYHYLAVFDDHTGQALYLGRTQRCATGAQKLMLFGRERGCTCPGCTVDFYRAQAHHGVADWKNDGQTNIDDLTLACTLGNQMIEDTGWVTRKRPDGRFEWIDPVTGRAHLNELHHPERLLTPEEDDDPP
ncbi:HNH endonuclease signature motif containing protein [Mycolicibacterium arenosum]|uniref:HNH endonuclease n=1 Tax=Mycolicibacterium arenosum TaxID=2952157 RepID=A0ABT1M589_9MYCO|nr:HNH endonuclease signature motif containing protein [Mycolicibacterium sp. CAU 1645]MCP9274331.1 HNH endonuclease [Mycolicibacterium sp. CAU 1645]